MIEISFKSEKDRVKGFAILLRSPYGLLGLEKNKFLIEDAALELVKDLINK